MPHPVRLRLVVSALAIAAEALCAPPASAATAPWGVAEQAVLYDGGTRVVGATVAFAHGREPRVALTTLGNGAPAMRVAVRDADGGWRVLPTPNGILTSGTPEVSIVWPPARYGEAWRGATLAGAAFGASWELPLPSGEARPVLPAGEVPRAIVTDANRGYRLATRRGGRWRSTRLAPLEAAAPVVLASERGAWSFVQKGTTLSARAIVGAGRFRVSDVANFKAALDPKGRASLAALSRDGRRIVLVDGAHRFAKGTLRLPRDVTVEPERCLESACRIVTHHGQIEHVLALPRGVALVYTLSTTTALQKCEPFQGYMHPCDPAGPVNTCPKPPKFTCNAPGVETREPRLAWLFGGEVRDGSLLRLLGWEKRPVDRMAAGDYTRQVLSAVADASGAVHVVVSEGSGRRARVRWLRLVPSADAPRSPDAGGPTRAWSSTFDLTPKSDEQLAFAGLQRQQAAGTPRYGADGVTTGAAGLGVLWAAELDGLDPRRAAVVTVELTVPDAPLCGTPGIQLFHGDRGAAIYLDAGGATLIDRYRSSTKKLDASLVGRHRLTLQVGAGGAKVLLDGAEIGQMELLQVRGPSNNGRLWIGQFSRCGSPGAPLTWHRIAVAQGALAP